jgi:hypothetical protein
MEPVRNSKIIKLFTYSNALWKHHVYLFGKYYSEMNITGSLPPKGNLKPNFEGQSQSFHEYIFLTTGLILKFTKKFLTELKAIY